MPKPTLEIENPSNSDSAIKIINIYLRTMGYDTAKSFAEKHYADILMGKGSSHVWFKHKSDIHKRLAIAYL